MKKTLLLVAGLALVITACRKSQFDEVERTSGDADFSRYISVGNSLTQGYQDGGVYEEGQKNSYPLMIAQQMKIVDPEMGDFRQPDVFGNGSGYMHLEYVNGEIEVVSAGDPGGYDADPSWDTWGGGGPYNNLGISGVTLGQCVALDDGELAVNNGILGGISIPFVLEQDGNPFARFMDFGDNPFTGGTPVQYVDHIRNSNATFFTCWLGNNDVLGFATSGGVSFEVDLSFIGFGTIEFNALADPTEFRMRYDSVLTAFDDIGAKGVCATLPDVTAIPLFNTITVQGMKDDYGYDTVWVEDAAAGVRPATDDDLILLSAIDTVENGAGSSSSVFIENGSVLDAAEVALIQSTTKQINAEIKASAASFGFGVVDMYTILNNMKPGIAYSGIDFSPTYVEGGAFSLDGVHLNPRGYAIVANEFIEVINETYHSNIPKVAISAYRGVVFP